MVLSDVSEQGVVDADIGNFDHNEDPLDGKHTTHAIVTVV